MFYMGCPKGTIAWNKGTKGVMKANKTSFTKDTKAFKGRHHSEETKKKLSEANKGRKISEETREKLRGRTPWNKGLKVGTSWNKGLTKETDKRLNYDRPTSFKKGQKHKVRGSGMLGKHHSLESKMKIRESNLGQERPSIRGEKHYNWKGGITRLRNRLANQGKYMRWRSDVFKRDNYHCQYCGKKGYLEAHHIISVKIILKEFNIKTIEDVINCKELWDVNNGITYCLECHAKNDKFRKLKIVDTVTSSAFF